MVRAVALLSSRETEHVQVFIRRLSLGLDQGAQQHLVSTTFGNPSEARDLVGGPYHALMPRALRGRFEPLDHFVLGHHLSVLGPLSARGSPHAAKRFIGFIPNPSDQNPWAHWRSPMDMMRQGWSTSLFHAAQQWSTRSS